MAERGDSRRADGEGDDRKGGGDEHDPEDVPLAERIEHDPEDVPLAERIERMRNSKAGVANGGGVEEGGGGRMAERGDSRRADGGGHVAGVATGVGGVGNEVGEGLEWSLGWSGTSLGSGTRSACSTPPPERWWQVAGVATWVGGVGTEGSGEGAGTSL
jgi:hypothetical protein